MVTPLGWGTHEDGRLRLRARATGRAHGHARQPMVAAGAGVVVTRSGGPCPRLGGLGGTAGGSVTLARRGDGQRAGRTFSEEASVLMEHVAEPTTEEVRPRPAPFWG